MPSIPLLLVAALPAAADDPVDFVRDVRPILAEHCFECHGPDEALREADLRLDTRDGLFGDLGGYFSVVPGDVEQSELLFRMFDEVDPMPPPDVEKRPTTEELETLRRWIEEGAPFEEHWAYVAPTRPAPPEVALADWARNEVDRFVLARLEAEGLAPSPEADPAALLRRVTQDLTGLPPTVAELDRFLSGEETYEEAVDRLLASPRFGEAMAREWLDAARYGDTHGLHLDNERTIWPYRDWVVRAYNDNKPFDEFTVEQLAGDLLPDPTPDQVIATGFNRCNPTTAEGGLIAEEYLVKYAVDRVETTATVWMATSMGCASCHDHKYDPFTQKEFYQLFAYFNSIDEDASDGNSRDPRPVVKAPTPSQAESLAGAQALVDALAARVEGPLPEVDAAQVVLEDETAAAVRARWSFPETLVARSRNGATLTELADGSLLAGGENPATDVYEVVARAGDEPVRAIRLEALRHESFEKGGVGRSSNSNIVLTDVRVEAAPVGRPEEYHPVSLTAAYADYSQANYDIEKSIDGDAQSGWAVDALPEDRAAIFVPETPIDFEGDAMLRVTLAHESQFAQHQLGRFRLATTHDASIAPTELGTWWSVGPFDGGHADRHGPEDGVDLTAAVEEQAWAERPEFVDGQVHMLLPGVNCSTYLFREVHAPSARRMTISLGSDDSLIVWLNGDVVLDENVARPVAADQNRVDLDLVEGRNEILLKVTNRGGGFGYYFAVAEENVGGLPLDVANALLVAREERSEAQAALLRDHYRRAQSPEWAQLDAELTVARTALTAVEATVPTTMVMQERAEPRPAYFLVRGQYDQKGEEVARATPSALPAPPDDAPSDRLGLALWLTDPGNPLTARVTVNRLWQRLFGTGIVKTAEDFGSRGELPSHPELLDWLAVEFVEGGWDVKATIRRLVTSSTYRQTAAVTPALLEVDPENRLLSRGPRFRLAAEEIRDAALFTGGLMVERLGGPPVKPYQPAGLWRAVAYPSSNTANFRQDSGEALYRRSLYTFWKRTSPPPSMTLLDAPSREACTVMRARTNTPLQALVLLNDVQFVEAARAFGARALREGGEGDDARLTWAFRAATSTAPAEAELAVLRGVLTRASELYAADPAAALGLVSTGDSAPPDDLDVAELAAWTVVANTLLNLDAFVTKG